MNILFLCTGNSCRSIMAEALLKAVAPAGVTVQSAGSHPAGHVHPMAIAMLQNAGLSTKDLFSKSWDNLPEKPDAVITLCSGAAAEACPAYLGNVARSHWGMPDPAGAQGGEAAVAAVFRNVFDELRQLTGLLAKRLAENSCPDAQELQKILDEIAAAREGEDA